MLNIILSQQQLVAGTIHEDNISWINLGDDGQQALQSENPENSLQEKLGDILDMARAADWFHGTEAEPCPVLIATSIHEDVTELKLAVSAALNSLNASDFRLEHVDIMAWSYLLGNQASPVEGEKAIVLEGLGKSAMLYELEYRKGLELPAEEETGARYIFRPEKTSRRKLSGLGAAAGREKVLAALMKEFSSAGISLDAETQTSLAGQVTKKPLPPSYSLSRETGKVVIQAEATFTEEELNDYMLGDYQALRPQLKADVIKSAGISQVWLMGPYFHQPKLISFLREDCKLDTELKLQEDGSLEGVYDLAMKGLHSRHASISAAEEKKAKAEAAKREAEEKKAAIAAELKMKDERDKFLQEIKDTCTDPARREEYEEAFVSRGESLGIPDLVIKWNITEALSRIELVQESEQMGIDLPKEVPAAKPEPEVVDDSQTPEPVPLVEAEQPEPAKTPEPVAETPKEAEPALQEKPEVAEKVAEKATPEQSEVETPEPVLEPVGAGGTATVAVPVAKKQVQTKPSRKRDQVSLEDIFTFKGDLPDTEFITRKATFHQDSDVKVVRILSADLIANGDAVGNFRRVYDKELAYFGEMSEISESKDGMYFYRKYIERQSLRDYGKRHGLANKKSIEDLSSSDLKFILTLLKEVQELPVSHGNLTADNILIVNKRKWNLSKDLEVKFVDFHSSDVSEEESIAQAHKALGDVIGEKVYLEFKDKFQL